jgi:hypothetical protein
LRFNLFLINKATNRTNPNIARAILIGTTCGPNPIYLFALIKISTINEYAVNDLCTQQKWNTSDNANIKIDGSIEHPTMESANIKLHPATANIVYIHINRNIIIGIYFKHSIAVLWFFINVFILL